MPCETRSRYRPGSTDNSPTPEAERAELAEGCRSAGIGCFDCKKALLEHIDEQLAPVRERYRELTAKPEELREILAAGAESCRRTAREVLAETREAMGFHA